MARKASCSCGLCANCKARIAMREKRAKDKDPELDPDLAYLNELIEKAKDRDK